MSLVAREHVCGFVRGGPDPPPEKSQVAVGLPRNTGMDSLEKLLGSGSNRFSREVHMALCELH